MMKKLTLNILLNQNLLNQLFILFSTKAKRSLIMLIIC
jgi:hypothetical protein